MSIFTKNELDHIWTLNRATVFAFKSSDVILKEASAAFDPAKEYDIFLSHSYKDKNTIVGLYHFLRELGKSVYVDWIDDAQLDRTSVTKETALLLRTRMKKCKSLFYVTSENYTASKWMPWELGYFDGLKNKAAILPVTEVSEKKDQYFGTEYLGLYPYITKELDTNQNMTLWVNLSSNEYVSFAGWLSGILPKKH